MHPDESVKEPRPFKLWYAISKAYLAVTESLAEEATERWKAAAEKAGVVGVSNLNVKITDDIPDGSSRPSLKLDVRYIVIEGMVRSR